MEHYIAIDNVCAWPNLTQMPDGAIIATIFNQPCHGLWEGDVECWASEDGGRLWQLRGTPAPHEPGTNRMNVAAGLAACGDLIVIASGWNHRPRKGEGEASHGGDAHPLTPWVCRSADGGRTWTRAETLPPPAGKSARIIPFGDVVQLQDGTLGVCIYSWQPPHEHNCYFYSSADDGRTWTIRGVIQESNINETTPLALPNGDLLACARTLDDQHLELFRSTDHGRTAMAATPPASSSRTATSSPPGTAAPPPTCTSAITWARPSGRWRWTTNENVTPRLCQLVRRNKVNFPKIGNSEVWTSTDSLDWRGPRQHSIWTHNGLPNARGATRVTRSGQ